jgi:hypothetical protein
MLLRQSLQLLETQRTLRQERQTLLREQVHLLQLPPCLPSLGGWPPG